MAHAVVDAPVASPSSTRGEPAQRTVSEGTLNTTSPSATNGTDAISPVHPASSVTVTA